MLSSSSVLSRVSSDRHLKKLNGEKLHVAVIIGYIRYFICLLWYMEFRICQNIFEFSYVMMQWMVKVGYFARGQLYD
jgi:hypothetical protein